MRLEELNAEADRWTLEQHRAEAKQPKKAVSKSDLNTSKIAALRQKTAKINLEMETDKRLAAEEKRHLEASVALYLAICLLLKGAHDEDMRRVAHYYSGFCEEVSPNWREQATAAFRNKRL